MSDRRATRTVVDARTAPVTITTMPAAPVALRPSVPAPHRRLAPVARRTPGYAWPLAATAATALVAATGFTLGALGIGLGLLADLGLAVLTAGAVAALTLLTGRRVHCPGCPRR